MALTADQKDNFFKHHLPHRLCLLTTFRDRQAWFAKRIGKKDKDLLRASKDSSLIMIRMFAEFLGLKEGRDRFIKRPRDLVDQSIQDECGLGPALRIRDLFLGSSKTLWKCH